MSLHFLSILFCCLAAGISHAAVKASVSLDTTSAVYVSPTDATDITIFAGYAGDIGGCVTAAQDNISVCNSCSALTLTGGVYQCVQRSIYPNLELTITMSLDTIPNTPKLVAQWKDSSGDLQIEGAPTSFTANEAFTVKIKWSTICARTTNIASAACGAGGGRKDDTDSLLVGLTDGGTAFASGNYQKFTVRMAYVDPSDNADIVAAPTQSPTSGQGFTDFKVTPGDGKIYVGDIWRGGTTRANSSSGIKWNALRIYYAPYNSGSTPDFNQITYNGDNYTDLAVEDKNNTKTSLSDNKVTGLINEQPYMFNIATVDEATIVSGFINPTALNTAYSADPLNSRYTAQPGEVVGLLDNKKCFIATAAFGSQMAPQVELLRQFRNHFLVPTEWGREFVRLYYKYSPPAAQFISEHDGLRAVIRGALWPVVFFADLSLRFGFFLTFGLFALTLLSLILLVRHLRRPV